MGKKSTAREQTVSAMRKIEAELVRLEEKDRVMADSFMLLDRPPSAEETAYARKQGRCAVEGRLQDMWLLGSERWQLQNYMERLRLKHARLEADLGVWHKIRKRLCASRSGDIAF